MDGRRSCLWSGAALSHGSAASLWEIAPERGQLPEVSLPSHLRRRPRGVRIHRRKSIEATLRHRIPVTTPTCTLIDLASYLPHGRLEAAINEADKRGLTRPDALRAALADLHPRQPGVARLRKLLDKQTFRLTDSELERRFLAIVREAGLPVPETGSHVDGFKVDFHWPELALIVETDGLRYHRTPAQQARDRERDHAHLVAGRTPLRFTHAQVRFEPDHVRSTLANVVRRLLEARGRK